MFARVSAVDFDPSDFSRRHIGPSPAHMREMLSTIGAADIGELIPQTVPGAIRQAVPLALPAGISETDALQKLRIIADKNKIFTSLIGQGYYGTILPPVIQRNVLENPAWYTAYTPYQPEISQGRLEALHARHRECLLARRGDRRGGSHGDGAPRGQIARERVFRRRRVPPANDC